VRVGALCLENLIHEGGDGFLLGAGYVGYWQLFPVIWIEIGIAASVRAQEIARGGRASDLGHASE
jgi:hypothetical protein